MLEYLESVTAGIERLGDVTGLLAVYTLLNGISFAIYGWDKWCAKRGLRRIPEKKLLGLAALGGALGAWSAMTLFRHKTRKPSFRRPLIAATLLNALWIWAAYRIFVP